MPEIRTWYTFATDVLAYMNPRYKIVLGITRRNTYKKLVDSKEFLICPKDTRRHKKEIFKSIYHPLFERKNDLVLPDDQFLIELYGKIDEGYIIDIEDEQDVDFLKALGPFSTWTIEHIINYGLGKNTLQYGVKAGTLAVFIIRCYKLNKEIKIHRPSAPGVSNQYFNVKIESANTINYKNPIIPDNEFKEITYSIKYIYTMYSTFKKLKKK